MDDVLLIRGENFTDTAPSTPRFIFKITNPSVRGKMIKIGERKQTNNANSASTTLPSVLIYVTAQSKIIVIPVSN